MLSLSPTAPHQKLLSTEFCNFCSQQISQACSVLKDSNKITIYFAFIACKEWNNPTKWYDATIDFIDAIDNDILEKFVVGWEANLNLQQVWRFVLCTEHKKLAIKEFLGFGLGPEGGKMKEN